MLLHLFLCCRFQWTSILVSLFVMNSKSFFWFLYYVFSCRILTRILPFASARASTIFSVTPASLGSMSANSPTLATSSSSLSRAFLKLDTHFLIFRRVLEVFYGLHPWPLGNLSNFQMFLCVCHSVTFKVNILGEIIVEDGALEGLTPACISMWLDRLVFLTKFLLQIHNPLILHLQF